MNRINPLHIGTLLIIVLIFVSINLESSKEDLKLAKEDLKETKELAIELSEFKDIYASDDKIVKSINRILSLNTLKTAKIMQKRTKSGITISSIEMNKKALNSLMGKLINGSYNIENLKIKKLNNEKVSLDLEIKW